MRGKGIGTQLLNGFFETVDKNRFTDVFIRVWNENKAALTLYQRFGFAEVATIEQMKTKPDGKGSFIMKKIYLHKKIN
jgi:ribosomal protein S18 acetylase RimI-like enzyme